MYGYRITIESWPYFMNMGRDEAQKLAGPRSQTFDVPAESLDKAVLIAKELVKAIKGNPHVHQAPIRSIEWLFG